MSLGVRPTLGTVSIMPSIDWQMLERNESIIGFFRLPYFRQTFFLAHEFALVLTISNPSC